MSTQASRCLWGTSCARRAAFVTRTSLLRAGFVVVVPVVLAHGGCGGRPSGDDDSGIATGCTGGNPVSGLVFEGAAGVTTSIGGASIDSCAILDSGCPNGASGSCIALSFGGDDGTRSMVIHVTSPLASGTFDCASSELVAISLSQTNAIGETVFGGVAGQTGTQRFGSCTVSNTSLDARHWAGQVEAELEDRLHGTTASLSLTGHMTAR